MFLQHLCFFKLLHFTVRDPSGTISFWKLPHVGQFSFPFAAFLNSQLVSYPARGYIVLVEEEFVSLIRTKAFANRNNLSGHIYFTLSLAADHVNDILEIHWLFLRRNFHCDRNAAIFMFIIWSKLSRGAERNIPGMSSLVLPSEKVHHYYCLADWLLSKYFSHFTFLIKSTECLQANNLSIEQVTKLDGLINIVST